MGYTKTTRRIHSFVPSEPKVKLRLYRGFRWLGSGLSASGFWGSGFRWRVYGASGSGRIGALGCSVQVLRFAGFGVYRVQGLGSIL